MNDTNSLIGADRIKNYAELAAAGDKTTRGQVLEVLTETLAILDSDSVIERCLSLDGDTLKIGNSSWDLSQKKNIYVIGAGKACNSMARALNRLLGSRITDGIGIVKILDPEDDLEYIRIYKGGHPIPNEEGYEASLKIIELVDKAGPDDLFISLFSGGCTAQMSLPLPGITLEDEKAVSKIMLNAGCRIMETNAVRRHISQVNGGRLAMRILGRGAELINLILWDAVGGDVVSNLEHPVEFGSGSPFAPDNTTVEDANRAIHKYNLQNVLPQSVVSYLASGKPEVETPKSLPGRLTHFVLQVPSDSTLTAQNICTKKNIPSYVLTNQFEGESREAGIFLATIAKEIAVGGQPFTAPCFLLLAGESTVRVGDSTHKGGPNQELALSFAREIDGHKGICLASIGTDGTDGPTPLAGGLADGQSASIARANGIDMDLALEEHAAYNASVAMNGGIITGNTGTNLCDLILVYIAEQK